MREFDVMLCHTLVLKFLVKLIKWLSSQQISVHGLRLSKVNVWIFIDRISS